MKKLYIYITLAFSFGALAQNGNVGIGTTAPDASAALEMVSTNQGFLVNRVALSNVTNTLTPVNAPATGLLVYNTNAATTGGSGEGFYYFNGTQWVKIGTAAGWSLTGDAGTTAGTNFLGTTNAQDLVISANALEAIRVEAGGDIGIGTNNPTAMFHVEGTAIPGTVYSNDFESETTGTLNTTGTGTWTVSSIASTDCADAAGTCENNRAYIYSTSDTTDATLILGPFQAIQTSINISFNWGHREQTTGSGKAGDMFQVSLVGGTGAGLLVNQGDASSYNQTFTSGAVTVDPLTNYYIHVRMVDKYAGSIDNVLVTQASTSVMRIQDGSEQLGHVLTSDANGYASWRDPKIALAEEDWAFFSGSTINDPMYHQGLVRGGSTAVATRTLDLEYSLSSAINPGATSFGLGSVELFADVSGLNLIIAVNNDIAPQIDNTITLGESTQAWREIFLINATITTSDERLKDNIKPIQYGINDVMKLKPSEYYWTDEQYIKRGVPLDQKRKKLGLIAQELLEVVPEVVTTHQWVKKSEKENDTFVLKENERLGVNYAELIPVLVKATQDQQELIEKLKNENEKLERQLEKK